MVVPNDPSNARLATFTMHAEPFTTNPQLIFLTENVAEKRRNLARWCYAESSLNTTIESFHLPASVYESYKASSQSFIAQIEYLKSVGGYVSAKEEETAKKAVERLENLEEEWQVSQEMCGAYTYEDIEGYKACAIQQLVEAHLKLFWEGLFGDNHVEGSRDAWIMDRLLWAVFDDRRWGSGIVKELLGCFGDFFGGGIKFACREHIEELDHIRNGHTKPLAQEIVDGTTDFFLDDDDDGKDEKAVEERQLTVLRKVVKRKRVTGRVRILKKIPFVGGRVSQTKGMRKFTKTFKHYEWVQCKEVSRTSTIRIHKLLNLS